MNLYLILLVFAFVCAVLAAFNVGAPRWNLIAAALAFYFAALIFGGFSGGRHVSTPINDGWPASMPIVLRTP